ncbi:hypothetical protein HDU82_004417 [Entophlyctis luteolus]|nr:hypothetical protein HDU82_004417 [Entophlyctis luteolus]
MQAPLCVLINAMNVPLDAESHGRPSVLLTTPPASPPFFQRALACPVPRLRRSATTPAHPRTVASIHSRIDLLRSHLLDCNGDPIIPLRVLQTRSRSQPHKNYAVDAAASISRMLVSESTDPVPDANGCVPQSDLDSFTTLPHRPRIPRFSDIAGQGAILLGEIMLRVQAAESQESCSAEILPSIHPPAFHRSLSVWEARAAPPGVCLQCASISEINSYPPLISSMASSDTETEDYDDNAYGDEYGEDDEYEEDEYEVDDVDSTDRSVTHELQNDDAARDARYSEAPAREHPSRLCATDREEKFLDKCSERFYELLGLQCVEEKLIEIMPIGR